MTSGTQRLQTRKNKKTKPNWLVVSTHLKNITQFGSFPQIGVKIKKMKPPHSDHSTTPNFCCGTCKGTTGSPCRGWWIGSQDRWIYFTHLCGLPNSDVETSLRTYIYIYISVQIIYNISPTWISLK